MLQIVIDEAMAGWGRSVNEGTRTVSVRRSTDRRGSEASKSTITTAGDPEFLRVAMEAMRQIRELYGIDGTASGGVMGFDCGGTLKITTDWGTPAETGVRPPPRAFSAASVYQDEAASEIDEGSDAIDAEPKWGTAVRKDHP